MEELCKNCQHFEPKGLMIDRNTWGLCPKFGNRGKPGIFRWGDAICADFKPSADSKEPQNSIKQSDS
jgi:hypothetical protein